MRRIRLTAALAIPVLALIVAQASCMNTPTLPAPPPVQEQFMALDPPDAEGYVEIIGLPGAFPEWDLAANRSYGLVFNLNTHRAVIEPAEMNGSFYARIEASSGDEISVQTRFNDGTESIPILFTVPYP